MKNALNDMAQIGQMVLDGELAELKDVANRISAVQRELAEMDQLVAARAAVARVEGREDLALVNGQDEVWLEWVAHQKAEARMRLAQLSAEREEKLARARRAFGRSQAIGALQDRAKVARSQKGPNS